MLLKALEDRGQRIQALMIALPYLWGKPSEVELTDEAEQMDAELAAIDKAAAEVEQMSDEELQQQLLATMASEASGKQ